MRCSIAVAVLLIGSSPAVAQTGRATTAPGPTEEVEAAIEGFRRAESAWLKDLRAWKKTRTQLRKANRLSELPKPPTYPFEEHAREIRRLAKKHAQTADAVPALVWLVSPSRMADAYSKQSYASGVAFALDRCARDHAEDRRIRSIVFALSRSRYLVTKIGLDPIARFVRAFCKAQHDPETKALASFSLAQAIHRLAQTEKGQTDRLLDQALPLFEEASKAGSKVVRELAQRFVREISAQRVGMKAPDFSGRDVTGKAIRLSDYVGRTVLLNFWGFW